MHENEIKLKHKSGKIYTEYENLLKTFLLSLSRYLNLMKWK